MSETKPERDASFGVRYGGIALFLNGTFVQFVSEYSWHATYVRNNTSRITNPPCSRGTRTEVSPIVLFRS